MLKLPHNSPWQVTALLFFQPLRTTTSLLQVTEQPSKQLVRKLNASLKNYGNSWHFDNSLWIEPNINMLLVTGA
jgi:hypothetical protein